MRRRLRSLIPTSPFPWHWHARFWRALLAAVLILAAAGAVVSVIVQRQGEDGSDDAAASVQPGPQVAKALAGMSPAQKADAVVAAGVDAGGAEAAVAAAQLGGVVIGADDWASGGAGLVRRIREAGAAGRRIPPFIIGLQEGGTYRSYPDLPPLEPQLDVGISEDPAFARAWSENTASALKKAGFDLNLAPLADVATLDSPIADRSFGDDPALVASLTSAAVKGCEATGLACAIAHFPGLGGASDDTAVNPATVGLDPDSLEARDLVPFEAAFKAGVPAAVVSLASYVAYDPVTPAALSPAVATDLLRDDLGFKGLAISDDLTSGSIAVGLGAPEAAVQAIAAGVDLAVVDDPRLATEARSAILAASRNGTLDGARLDDAVARVLTLKRKIELLPDARK